MGAIGLLIMEEKGVGLVVSGLQGENEGRTEGGE